MGEAEDVVAGNLSATVSRERVSDARDAVRATTMLPPDVVRTVQGSHRYGNCKATITGAELRTAAGDPVSAWKPRSSVAVRLSFQVPENVPSPIAGFLVRNEKGETIFGSNTARENYPLPAMGPGDLHTVAFHWTMPELADGRYSISIAVSEGTLERFEVCDYVEDAIIVSAKSDNVRAGYLQLQCSRVSVIRSQADAIEISNPAASYK